MRPQAQSVTVLTGPLALCKLESIESRLLRFSELAAKRQRLRTATLNHKRNLPACGKAPRCLPVLHEDMMMIFDPVTVCKPFRLPSTVRRRLQDGFLGFGPLSLVCLHGEENGAILFVNASTVTEVVKITAK